MLGEDAKNVQPVGKLWMSSIASGLIDMTEYEVYCPAHHRMVKVEATLKEKKIYSCILTIHIDECLFEGDCQKKGGPDCALGQDLQGRWDKP